MGFGSSLLGSPTGETGSDSLSPDCGRGLPISKSSVYSSSGCNGKSPPPDNSPNNDPSVHLSAGLSNFKYLLVTGLFSTFAMKSL